MKLLFFLIFSWHESCLTLFNTKPQVHMKKKAFLIFGLTVFAIITFIATTAHSRTASNLSDSLTNATGTSASNQLVIPGFAYHPFVEKDPSDTINSSDCKIDRDGYITSLNSSGSFCSVRYPIPLKSGTKITSIKFFFSVPSDHNPDDDVIAFVVEKLKLAIPSSCTGIAIKNSECSNDPSSSVDDIPGNGDVASHKVTDVDSDGYQSYTLEDDITLETNAAYSLYVWVQFTQSYYGAVITFEE